MERMKKKKRFWCRYWQIRRIVLHCMVPWKVSGFFNPVKSHVEQTEFSSGLKTCSLH